MNNPRISVVIPHYGSKNLFYTRALPFLRRTQKLYYQIIIADANPKPLEVEALDLEHCRILNCAKGRGLQLATGAAEACGEWLLFLHSDTELIGAWQAAMEEHIARYPHMAAVFELTYDEPGFASWFVGRWGTVRTRWFGVPYGDQGLLISRVLYDEIGGYDRTMPLMEDVDIINRIGRNRFRMIAGSTFTSSEKYLKEGWFRRGMKHWYYYTAYRFGLSSKELYRRYYDH